MLCRNNKEDEEIGEETEIPLDEGKSGWADTLPGSQVRVRANEETEFDDVG